MSDSAFPPRPQTPQVLVHRLPDKTLDADPARKPAKYIVLIEGSTSAAGKVQIASSVARALSCPFYQGDSMHESSAKAASVGASRPVPAAAAGGGRDEPGAQSATAPTSGPNEARYQRMWLSKMTRTGLLFPEESRAATEGFSGFGGASSTSTSRRGSASSTASVSSSLGPSSSAVSTRSDSMSSSQAAVNNALPPDTSASGLHAIPFTQAREKELQRKNPVLMVVTHPELQQWHLSAIRAAVGDYSIGVIHAPLEDFDRGDDEEDLPILRPLDPTMMTSFPVSFGSFAKKPRGWGNLDEEMKLRVDFDADVQGMIDEIVEGVKDVIGIDA